MTEEMINTCEYYKICEAACGGTLEDTELCSCYQLYKQLKRLEQENKELKEKKDKYYQQTLDDEILMNELSLEVDLRKKESDFYLEKLSKYRSALEEIKEIADKCKECLNEDDDCGCDYLRIVRKINEVLQCE